MHHPESAGDSAGTRKMAHPAMFPRRGSNTGVGSVSALTTVASTSISNNVPNDDYQSPMLIQSSLPAGSSSPGPQHPPHSLNLLSQSQMQAQALPSAGAQMRKKSGFQITSVTPAQISVSTNNSIAEDTESYDDLDESHTEDLSSSEILDVSLSRATDMGGPERSSSEETLSNFHDADTPGAVSPNQPPHPLPQVPQHITMVNGTVHHHHPHHHGHHLHHQGHHHQQVPTTISGVGPPSVSTSVLTLGATTVSAAVTSTPGTLHSVTQKLPASIEAVLENTSVVGSVGLVAQPAGAVVPGAAAGMLSAAAGAKISVVNPLASNVSNVNMLSSASVSGLGGTSRSSGSIPPGLMNLNSGSGSVLGSSSQNVTLIQQQSGAVSASVAMTTTGTSTTSMMGPTGGNQIGTVSAPHLAAVVPTPTLQSQPQLQAPATTSSRFRVVKLDSSSEPFKKGRWTCTEYYDKEMPTAPPPSSDSAPSHRVVESLRQSVSENVASSERDSTSGSSVSSSVSTLSHYSESVGSGEIGGSSAQQVVQPQDYTQVSLPGQPQSITQPHVQPQDVVTPLQRTSIASSVPVTIGTVIQQAPVNQSSLQATGGHAAQGLPQQQVAYAQRLQPAPAQVGYPPVQQSAPPASVAPTHIIPVSQGLPPDFTPQPVIQTTMQTAASGTTHLLPHIPSSVPPSVMSGNGHMMATGPPLTASVPNSSTQPLPQGLMQQQPQGPLPQIAPPSQGVGLSQMLPGNVSGLTRTQKIPSQLSVEQQQQPPGTQGLGSQLPSAVLSSQVTSTVPPSLSVDSQASLAQSAPPVQNGSAAAHPSGVVLAPGQGALPTVSTLYASLPSITATQLEDAQRLLFQHQSLLSLPKLATGECASEAGASLGQEDSSSVNALPVSASLFPLKNLPVDGEEDSLGTPVTCFILCLWYNVLSAGDHHNFSLLDFLFP
ncbi:hypothetical protein JZ751_027974, partial [Albula glossodonta]